MDNRAIAKRLMDYAEFLDAREVNVYRPKAYRRAAETVLGLGEPIAHIVQEKGRQGLEELPGIGRHISYTIDSLVRTGEFRTLNGEGGHIDPEQLFASLPGIGSRLARRIHQEFGVSTLEHLERVVHEGRLNLLNVGPKRARGISDALAGRLGRHRLAEPIGAEPAVAELLAIDAEYRRQASAGALATVTPRRFNPDNEPVLPVLDAARAGWRFLAAYSNTPLANRLGRTRDWVVVRFDDGAANGQRTVATETRGDLTGLRVVRGRESECRTHHQRPRTG